MVGGDNFPAGSNLSVKIQEKIVILGYVQLIFFLNIKSLHSVSPLI